MVMPNNISANSIVRLLWVITIIWEFSPMIWSRSLKRNTLASSNGASISSSRQKEAGLIRNIEKINAIADKAFSPPESRLKRVSFFPGGWIISSTPDSRGLSGSMRISFASPPSNRRGKTSFNFSFIWSKVAVNFCWVIVLIFLITFCRSSMAFRRSSRWVSRNSKRSFNCSYSLIAQVYINDLCYFFFAAG